MNEELGTTLVCGELQISLTYGQVCDLVHTSYIEPVDLTEVPERPIWRVYMPEDYDVCIVIVTGKQVTYLPIGK